MSTPESPPPDAPASGEAVAAPAEARPATLTFRYGADGVVELGPSGLRAPRWPARGEAFVAYRDVTHVALEPRALAVGTLHGVLLLGRAQLGGSDAALALANALRARVFALPSGDAIRARFERLDSKARMRWPWIAALLVALTGVVYLLQNVSAGFTEAAVYRPGPIAAGEWWRYATAQFLHANLGHLAVNAAASLIAGAFVERALGRMGTLMIAGAAGAGSMLASRLGGYAELLGFSGVAAGFFGALVAVEFFAPAEAPATARIPRPILLSVIALQALFDLAPSPPLPAWAAHSAGFAHLGGFAAGAVAALLVRPGLRAFVVAGGLASVLVTVASFAAVGRNLLDPGAALERQAREMLSGRAVNAGELNNLAWAIATSAHPTKTALDQAVKLAELAVQVTGAQEPTVLDTLAEVYFAAGRKQDALDTIDQAIALAPGEKYYGEQRRRFAGERAADDRPAPPVEAQPAPPGNDEEAPAAPPQNAPPDVHLPPGDEVTV